MVGFVKNEMRSLLFIEHRALLWDRPQVPHFAMYNYYLVRGFICCSLLFCVALLAIADIVKSVYTFSSEAKAAHSSPLELNITPQFDLPSQAKVLNPDKIPISI